MSTVSEIPGRVRFAIDALRGNFCLKNYLERELMKLKGVESVEINYRTGRALILYDTQIVNVETIRSNCQRLIKSYFLETMQKIPSIENRHLGIDSLSPFALRVLEMIVPKPFGIFLPLINLAIKTVRGGYHG